MASSFVGLHLCLPKQDRPDRIRVRDDEGSEKQLTIREYEEHAVQPSWQSLPWEGEPSATADDGAKTVPDVSL